MAGTLEELMISDIGKLESDADTFDTSASKIKKVTQNMLDLIEQTKPVWDGDARETYTNQFRGLEDDMQRIYELCQKYHDDVKEIAAIYRRTESENQEEARKTKTSITMGQF